VDVLGDRKNLFRSSGDLCIESSYRCPVWVSAVACVLPLLCVGSSCIQHVHEEHTHNKLSLRPLASFPLVFLQTVSRVGALEM